MVRAEHGGSGTLYNRGCRCTPCVVSHRIRVRTARKRRFNERVWKTGPDGQKYLYAARASVHGHKSTYINWGCRCPECSQAASVAMAEYWKRRSG